MADISIDTSVNGTDEGKNKLNQLGNEVDNVGKKSEKTGGKTRKLKEAYSQLATSLSGAAAVASFFARGNVELQRSLEVVALAAAGSGAMVRAMGDTIKFIVSGPLTMILGAIGAVIAITVTLIKYWDEAKEIAVKIWTAISNFLSSIWSGLTQSAHGLGQIIKGALTLDTEMIKAGWEEVKAGVIKVGETVVNGAKAVAEFTVKATKNIIATLTNKAATEMRLAEQVMDYEVRIGKKTYDDKVRLLQAELKMVRGNKEEELRLLNAIAQARENQLAKDLEGIKLMGGLTKSELIAQLEILKQKYETMGDAGVVATKKIAQEIKNLKEDVGTLGQMIAREMEERVVSVTRRAADAFGEVRDSWTSAFEDLFTGAKTFMQVWDNFWTSVRNIALKKIAAIVADKLWNTLFSGLENLTNGFGGGSASGGTGTPNAGGGIDKSTSAVGGTLGGMGGWWGAIAAGALMLSTEQGREALKEFIKGIPTIIRNIVNALPEIIRALVDAIPDITTALIEAIPDVINAIIDALPYIIESFVKSIPDIIKAFIKAVPSIIEAIVIQIPMIALEFTGAILKGAYEFVAEIIRGAGRFIEEIIKGAGDIVGDIGIPGVSGIPYIPSSGDTSDVVNSIFPGLGDLLDFAHGGEAIVTSPTLMTVGERGAERVSIEPLAGGSGRGGGGITNVFQGALIMDEITMRKWVRLQRELLQKENRRY